MKAIIELDKEHKTIYQQNCFNNEDNYTKIFNENHLIEKHIQKLTPGHLIIFGKLDKNFSPVRNRLIISTNGILKWNRDVENFVWNNLGKINHIFFLI